MVFHKKTPQRGALLATLSPRIAFPAPNLPEVEELWYASTWRGARAPARHDTIPTTGAAALVRGGRDAVAPAREDQGGGGTGVDPPRGAVQHRRRAEHEAAEGSGAVARGGAPLLCTTPSG